ncbi:glutamate synthase subunit beta [Streptomyces sp. B1866]|uniref:glutamate synthase subunit beta n=1 Tax=Streptomyces sp. B1866 TaxID=3075431 RepID=UPI00288D6E33|nr:glutamate synthase subunit beta [Streptomyces sp. B1866]MDT3396033.1 glutamate synthase subunit beta [Streptomyces sp. B1866]
MADPKGFLTTPPRLPGRRPVHERVRDWDEVPAPGALLPIVGAQAGRCMDCGVPFCHHGCPLGNLIPEWNTLVSRGDFRRAAEWLHATNNFPEFTGRLCPAPCESACVLALSRPAVTIKNVELAIADRAWQEGDVPPRPPARRTGTSVAVVGSGPAGLAAAQQLTRAGHAVTVYERADRAGGLLRYGIPAFKLDKRHLDRRLEQMRAEGTAFVTGAAVGTDLDAAELRARCDAVVVAVGATAWRDLPVPGRGLDGVHQAMEYLPAANRVQEGDYARPPLTAEGKRVVIVGGGDTGADCLGTALRQGASAVTQLDIHPRPGDRRPDGEPWPVHPKVYRLSAAHEEAGELGSSPYADADARVFSAATLRFEGDGTPTGPRDGRGGAGRPDGAVRALRLAEAAPDGTPVPGTERVIPADLVLLALGFRGPEPDSALADPLGLRLDERGGFARDAAFGAGADGVFVAGDAGRGQSLIVWAIAEGRSVAAAVDRYLTGSTALTGPVTPTDRPLSA